MPIVDLEHCEFCGAWIEEPGQQCMARDPGHTCDPDPLGLA